MGTLGSLILGLVIGWLAHKLLSADRADHPALPEPERAGPSVAPERDPNVRPLSETAAAITGKAAAVAGVAAGKVGHSAHRAADVVTLGAQRAAEALQSAAGRMGAAEGSVAGQRPPGATAADPAPAQPAESAGTTAAGATAPAPVSDLASAHEIIEGQQAEIHRLQALLEEFERAKDQPRPPPAAGPFG